MRESTSMGITGVVVLVVIDILVIKAIVLGLVCLFGMLNKRWIKAVKQQIL